MSERIVKTCPRCGQPLIIRRNHATGEEFLACTAFRDSACTWTEPLPEAIKLRRAGQKELFEEESQEP